MSGNDFEWWGADRESVVVEEQPAIAVYSNPGGAVVIRQRDWPEDDVYITVRPENARALAAAIIREAQELTEAVASPSPRAGRNGAGSSSPRPSALPPPDGLFSPKVERA